MNLPVLKLPRMQCDSHCGKCCGPVTCYPYELDAIREYIEENNITPLRQGITCPLYIGGQCSVHPVRPFICQLFGHSPRLVCHRGYNVNIPERKERKLATEYKRIGIPDSWLHSLAYNETEIAEILTNYAAGKR